MANIFDKRGKAKKLTSEYVSPHVVQSLIAIQDNAAAAAAALQVMEAVANGQIDISNIDLNTALAHLDFNNPKAVSALTTACKKPDILDYIIQTFITSAHQTAKPSPVTATPIKQKEESRNAARKSADNFYNAIWGNGDFGQQFFSQNEVLSKLPPQNFTTLVSKNSGAAKAFVETQDSHDLIELVQTHEKRGIRLPPTVVQALKETPGKLDVKQNANPILRFLASIIPPIASWFERKQAAIDAAINAALPPPAEIDAAPAQASKIDSSDKPVSVLQKNSVLTVEKSALPTVDAITAGVSNTFSSPVAKPKSPTGSPNPFTDVAAQSQSSPSTNSFSTPQAQQGSPNPFTSPAAQQDPYGFSSVELNGKKKRRNSSNGPSPNNRVAVVYRGSPIRNLDPDFEAAAVVKANSQPSNAAPIPSPRK